MQCDHLSLVTLSRFYLQLLFLTPEGQNFWDNFAEHLEKFKEDCKHLSAESLVRLTEDPTSNFCNNSFLFLCINTSFP